MSRLTWILVSGILLFGTGAWIFFGAEKEADRHADSTAALTLPSGLEANFHEMLWNEPGEGLVYRFRFVAPDFKETGDVDLVMEDLQYLCAEYALPKLATKTGPTPGQLIISLADKTSEFGTYDPNVVQVFEAFDIKTGACIWEVF